ncbi:MAG: hypothetical protein IT381_27665 [Deltaproteobacteria bacterium]|nr:hypothetical protein [Deltaproteobacteria bacterium]
MTHDHDEEDEHDFAQEERYLQRIAAARAQRKGADSWALARIASPMWEGARRLDVIVVIDGDERLAAKAIVPNDAPVEAAADVLRQAMRQPKHGKVRKPSEVRVEDQALVPVLAAALDAETPVTVVELLHEADDVFAEMRDRLGARVPNESFARAGCDAALIKDYVQAMMALDACAPWEEADESQILGLEASVLGLDDVTLFIMNENADGLVLQEDGDLLALGDFEPGVTSEREIYAKGMITVSFVPVLQASTEMVLELRGTGLLKDEARAPIPVVLGRDACARLLTKRDVQVLTLAAKAVVRLFLTDGDVFAEDSKKDVTIDETFTIGGEEVTARIDAPHGDHPWGTLMPPGPEAFSDAEAFGEDDDGSDPPDLVDEELAPRGEESDICFELLAANAAQSAEWRVRAERIVRELFAYTRATEAKIGDWTMGELERFVLEDAIEHIPERETAALVPEVIVALGRLLQRARAPRIDLAAIEKRMRKIRPRLDEALAARHSKLLA